MRGYGFPTPRLLGYFHPSCGRDTNGSPLRTADELVQLLAVTDMPDRFCTKVQEGYGGIGFRGYRLDEDGGAVTDDHYFINQMAGIPTIDIINRRTDTESGFVPHWHTGSDGIDAIDKVSLGAAGQVVLAVIYREAAGTL